MYYKHVIVIDRDRFKLYLFLQNKFNKPYFTIARAYVVFTLILIFFLGIERCLQQIKWSKFNIRFDSFLISKVVVNISFASIDKF